ncbi:SAM-dependent methyltransferase [Paenibacillus zeisoli]|uniref:SAM-dependent methyltransferase n=2 Tax=Paenibacillus zeisoli TaxID=2496267 RepID=A0A433XRC1_9BACL|nr:SAM-dependent methyltransferase [Paenibacillus zeisoli]
MSRDSKKMNLDLDRIVFIGRTYSEYLNMFDLQESELEGRVILDCPAGACSFTAEGSTRGYDIMAADIAYQFGPDELELKGIQDLQHAKARLEEAREEYIWDYYGTVEGHQKYREEALAHSSNHRRQFPEKYSYVEFPKLPFGDQSVDLTLSAHFLFMYADRLSEQFHKESLLELMRITREEIRIFPLVDLSSRRYEALNKLIELAESKGWAAEERKTDYCFQKGADHYLKLTNQA